MSRDPMQLTHEQQAMLEVVGRHMQAETVTNDVDAALATMAATPHVNHVPVMAGGYGRDVARRFYTGALIGQFMPPDTEVTTVSRTIG